MKKPNPWTIPPHLLMEKELQSMIIKTYREVGVWVVQFSQPHKATQTRGIPDLLLYHHHGRWWHEIKTVNGMKEFAKQKIDRVTHQRWFHLQVEKHGDIVIVGGLNTAVRYMREAGIANLTQDFEGHW